MAFVLEMFSLFGFEDSSSVLGVWCFFNNPIWLLQVKNLSLVLLEILDVHAAIVFLKIEYFLMECLHHDNVFLYWNRTELLCDVNFMMTMTLEVRLGSKTFCRCLHLNHIIYSPH